MLQHDVSVESADERENAMLGRALYVQNVKPVVQSALVGVDEMVVRDEACEMDGKRAARIVREGRAETVHVPAHS